MTNAALTARGISQRLARAGHSRCRRDASMFAGFTAGYRVSGTSGEVFVEAISPRLYHQAEARDQMLDGYASTLRAAGFTVARDGGRLTITAGRQA
jgi:hypothetical protein